MIFLPPAIIGGIGISSVDVDSNLCVESSINVESNFSVECSINVVCSKNSVGLVIMIVVVGTVVVKLTQSTSSSGQSIMPLHQEVSFMHTPFVGHKIVFFGHDSQLQLHLSVKTGLKPWK